MKFINVSCVVLLLFVFLSPLNSKKRGHTVNTESIKRFTKNQTYEYPYGKKVSNRDMDILIRCVSSESGYCYSDSYRVAQVILNRCAKNKKTIREVVYEKNQFSGIGSRLWKSTDEAHMARVRGVCEHVLVGWIPKHLRLKRNVLYFINPKTAKGSWAAKMRKTKPVVVSENNHHYYAEKSAR